MGGVWVSRANVRELGFWVERSGLRIRNVQARKMFDSGITFKTVTVHHTAPDTSLLSLRKAVLGRTPMP